MRWTPEGYYRRYGSPNTPTDEGFYRIYDPLTGADDDWQLVPLVNMPQVFHAMQPGEASPTGKRGVGYVNYDAGDQGLDNLAATMFNYDTHPINRGDADLIMTGAVNPYDTITGDETYGSGYDSPGVKWTG